jgi:diguanylate cyclase (GGDEF)-like protein/PAS domain S-box-containing protein
LSARTTPTLSRRLAWGILIVCLGIVAMGGWRELSARGAALSRVEIETRNVAIAVRQHAEALLELVRLQLADIAGPAANSGSVPTELRGSLPILPVRPQRPSVAAGVIDPAGAVRWLSGPAPVPDDAVVAALGSATAESGGLSLGLPIAVPNGGRYLLPVATAGAEEKAVFALLDATQLAEPYGEYDLGDHGAIALLGPGGHLLTRSPFAAAGIGRNVLADYPEELHPHGGAGTFRVDPSSAKGERIGAYSTSAAFGFTVVASMSYADALAGWRQEAFWRLGVTVGLIAGLGIVAHFLFRADTRRREADAVIAQRDAEFRLLTEGANDLVERIGPDGTRLYVSPAFRRLLGREAASVVGTNAFETIHPDDRGPVLAAAQRLRDRESEEETVSFRAPHEDGRLLWLETSLRPAHDDRGERSGVVAVTRDITARKELELRLASLASQDGLTGLANRWTFDKALEAAIARARETRLPLSLLMVDVDRFKRYNDDFGHLSGDACLKAISEVVAAAAARAGDLAARYGGEEMAILLPNTDRDSARMLAAELCRQVEALAIPHERNLPWMVATVSVGVSCITGGVDTAGRDGDWLVSSADMALYTAKNQGRNQVCLAPPDLVPFRRRAF